VQGLYKVEFHTVHGSGRGVVYAFKNKRREGRLLGGNSAFAFIGSFDDAGDEISVEVSTERHHDDPSYRPLFGTDRITLTLKGWQQGDQFQFRGSAAEVPGVAFRSTMTPISDTVSSPVADIGKDGIRNGLYSIHIKMLDGIDGGNTGVMVLHDGQIHGGDAFFNYIGRYSCANGRWKGEIVNHEHTPSQGERPVFGGYEVGIGFSGSYTDDGANAEATALVGKRSIRFSAVLKRLAEASVSTASAIAHPIRADQ
jgi:T3SS negative regulator,GrlR